MAKLSPRSKQKGFTVFETIITLAILCSVLLIGTLQLKSLKQRIVFQSSIQEFQTAIAQASRIAVIRHETIKINYEPSSHCLEMAGNGYSQKRFFDEDLDITKLHRYNISENGMIQPKTITFNDGTNKQKITIQMAWGRIINED